MIKLLRLKQLINQTENNIIEMSRNAWGASDVETVDIYNEIISSLRKVLENLNKIKEKIDGRSQEQE